MHKPVVQDVCRKVVRSCREQYGHQRTRSCTNDGYCNDYCAQSLSLRVQLCGHDRGLRGHVSKCVRRLVLQAQYMYSPIISRHKMFPDSEPRPEIGNGIRKGPGQYMNINDVRISRRCASTVWIKFSFDNLHLRNHQFPDAKKTEPYRIDGDLRECLIQNSVRR